MLQYFKNMKTIRWGKSLHYLSAIFFFQELYPKTIRDCLKMRTKHLQKLALLNALQYLGPGSEWTNTDNHIFNLALKMGLHYIHNLTKYSMITNFFFFFLCNHKISYNKKWCFCKMGTRVPWICSKNVLEKEKNPI